MREVKKVIQDVTAVTIKSHNQGKPNRDKMLSSEQTQTARQRWLLIGESDSLPEDVFRFLKPQEGPAVESSFPDSWLSSGLLMRRFLVLFLVVVVNGQFLAPTAESHLTMTVPIATEFYVWYGFDSNGNCKGGLGSSHWNDTKDRVVVDTPRLGYYCSADDDVIRVQLSQIKSVGISVLIISWWNDLDTTKGLTHVISLINSDAEFLTWFKVVVLIESKVEDTFAHNAQLLYETVWQKFYEPNPTLLFDWDSKPVVLFFNQPKPALDNRFTVRTLGVDYSPDWDFWHGTDLYGTALGFIHIDYYENPRISNDGVVTVIGRFDDYYLYLTGSRPAYQRYDPNLNQGMYQH